MSTAYAISEGYWSTTDQAMWCPECLTPAAVVVERRLACIDDHGGHSLRIGAALYCFDHEGFVDELRSPGSDTE